MPVWTQSAVLAQIRAWLIDESDRWRDDVCGPDFVDAVTGILQDAGLGATNETERPTDGCPACGSLSPWRCGCHFVCPICDESEPESERGSEPYRDRCKDCEATARKAVGKAGE